MPKITKLSYPGVGKANSYLFPDLAIDLPEVFAE